MEYEQRDRDTNVIISGTDGKSSPEETRKLLNDALGINLGVFAIKYTVKLRTNDQTTRVRVVFSDKENKNLVMKAKKSLKGREQIWINDDLTLYRSKLAYYARVAVKEGHIAQTWCYDSKVFIKEEEGGKPKRITQKSDIPGHDTIGIGEEEFRLRNI